MHLPPGRPPAPDRSPARVLLGLRRAGSVSRWVIAAMAFVILVASGYAWAVFKNFTASVPHGDAVPALHSGQTDLDGGAQNILMIGNDSRAGATAAELKALHGGHDTQTVNTDTMMVLHIPSDGGSPTIISFPRDSWVDIPGYGK
ncbi:MAG TPA: LCP family protein, partial [Jatrophihabitantaceae bacterium]